MRLIGSPSRAYAADDERGFLPLGAAPAPLRSRYSRREALGLAAGGIFLPDWLRRQPEPVPVYGYRVVEAYPHDRDAYTEGLDYVDGDLYESTGLEGQSTLRRVDLETGEVLQSAALDPTYFGEGIVVVDDRIYMLTWKEQLCLVYDRAKFEVLDTFSYTTEGWGLTTDGTHLIMSDGTNRLTFRDPETFEAVDSVDVFYQNQAVQRLNELELIAGEVWANVYQTDFVARIDPATGQVASWVNLTGLLSERDRRRHPVDVLNGITHDEATGRIFVTGKLWPKLFQIEVVAPE